MAEDFDLEGIDRRARTAGYADGLLEIFAAAVLFTIASGWLVNPGLVGILAALVVLYGWRVVEKVKVKVTYPRLGYYRERSEEPRTTALGILAVMAGALVVTVVLVALGGGLAEAAAWRRAAPMLSGITLAGAFWYTAGRSGLLRYRAMAALSVLWGVALWLLGSGHSYAGVVWHLMVLAAPLALTGVWSLLRFRRSYPGREAAGE
jgi:hypothetical protein